MTIWISEDTQVCYGVRYNNTNRWVDLADLTYESTTLSDRRWTLTTLKTARVPQDYINSYEWIVGVSQSVGDDFISCGVSLTNSNPTSYLLASDVSSSDTIYIFDYYIDN